MQAVAVADSGIFSDIAHSLLVLAIGGIAKLALDHRALATRQEATMDRLTKIEKDADEQTALIQKSSRESGEINGAVKNILEMLERMDKRSEETSDAVNRIQGRLDEQDRQPRRGKP